MSLSKLVAGALRPTPSGAAILAVALWSALRQRAGAAAAQQSTSTSWLKAAFLLVLFINRGNLPLRWHLKLLKIGLRARVRFDLARLGLLKPDEQQRRIGLKGGEVGLMGVGRNVFKAITVRHTRVSFAEADYNLHLSNSNYAQAGDFARMQFASDYTGVITTADGIAFLLGATSFAYFREIPMFANYTTESRIVAFDDKWCYFLTRFIIPYDKRSKRAPSKSLETGKDCTVCAFLLSQLCFKRGRIATTPEKGLALAGLVGPEDEQNDPGRTWRIALDLRKRRGVKSWMQEPHERGEYLPGCEEQNEKALAIIRRLQEADRQAWVELDNVGRD